MIDRILFKSVYSLICITLLAACSPVETTKQPPAGARNVILFVGDGLGAGQTALGIQYGRLIGQSELNIDVLMQDGNTGYALPLPYERILTDSAAAATHFSTGQEVLPETLGLNPEGYPLETIVEWAHQRGLGTGLVSNMRVTHATPAAFAVHQGSRYVSEQEIMDDLLQQRDVDVFLGGGARALAPAGAWASEVLPGIPPELDLQSIRTDEAQRLDELVTDGYSIASDLPSLREAASHARKLMGLFAADHLPYVLDRRQMNLTNVPTLADMTSAAIDVLSRNDEGFFLLVEGGRIDYAGHANDPGTLLHEILDFDGAVGAGLAFQRSHPDTLVIVTGDHGTGGFSFAYANLGPIDKTKLNSGVDYQPGHQYPTTEPLEMLHRQDASLQYILQQAGTDPDTLIERVQTHTGLTITMDEAKEALVRDEAGDAWLKNNRIFNDDPGDNATALLGQALSRQTFVIWSSGGHTSDLVPTYARGPGADKFRGAYRNTHIYDVMREALEQAH
ncbi:MAG: alkaline phosphatase [Proteobacteria bacterium]|nr:alkaline phosphatase [Pseudomonadota bacterium]MDA0993047.1 alkaline phosphatase [Pseudomonadota bacterium]